MKKRLTIFLLTAAIIAFNGCENSFTELNSRNFPKGYGAVRVSVDGKTDTAADWRTVFPTEPKEDSIKYEYKFYTVREGESLSEVPAEDIIQSDNEFILPAGSYIVEVEASVGEDEGVTFAKGSANFTITEGTETDTVAVNLSYIDDNGKGTFKIDEIILEEEGFSYELIKLTKIEDETVKKDQNKIHHCNQISKRIPFIRS